MRTCATLGACTERPVMTKQNQEAMREAFEKMIRQNFVAHEISLNRTADGEYYSVVFSGRYKGRVQPEDASVSMLWTTWQEAISQQAGEPQGKENAFPLIRDDAKGKQPQDMSTKYTCHENVSTNRENLNMSQAAQSDQADVGLVVSKVVSGKHETFQADELCDHNRIMELVLDYGIESLRLGSY